MSTVIKHDPSAVLDYGWDWGTWLEDGRTIASHTVTADAGLTVGAVVADGSTVKARIAATPAANGKVLKVVCHIVDTAGQEDDRSHTILVTNR